MDYKKLLFFGFLLLLFVKFFIRGVFLTIFNYFIFFVPLIYFLKKKDFYIFYLNIKDSFRNIKNNLIFVLIIFVLWILISLFFHNFRWIFLTKVDFLLILELIIIGFFQEMLFRYFIQRNLINYINNYYISLLITSFLFTILNFNSIISFFLYFLTSLVISYNFENTRDIYGATICDSLIRLFIFIIG